jgi:hypothetical protein
MTGTRETPIVLKSYARPKARGFKLMRPTTLQQLIEQATATFKMSVVEIWDAQCNALTDVKLIGDNEVVYAATEADVQTIEQQEEEQQLDKLEQQQEPMEQEEK